MCEKGLPTDKSRQGAVIGQGDLEMWEAQEDQVYLVHISLRGWYYGQSCLISGLLVRPNAMAGES
jgi:hypothetical protein